MVVPNLWVFAHYNRDKLVDPHGFYSEQNSPPRPIESQGLPMAQFVYQDNVLQVRQLTYNWTMYGIQKVL